MPMNDGGAGDQSNAVEGYQMSQTERDVQVSYATPGTQTQKASVHRIPGVSIPMPFHQPQVPIQFGSINPQIQSQGTASSSLSMLMPLPMGNASQLQQLVFGNPVAQSPAWYACGVQSEPMQSLGSQRGIQRKISDSDRWQCSSAFQKGLVPSPPTPLQVLYKAEKKYEVSEVADEEEAKQMQLQAILNKLKPQNFDQIFEQVKAVNIDSAASLAGVVLLIFEKALMEPTFCEMCANLCYRLAQELPDFSEDNTKISFKRLLLSKCQEEFERCEREHDAEEESEEKTISVRRRTFGNIRLIGELYKKKMLTEGIMHHCIQKLLGQYQNPNEEDIEALCILISTIGEMIDHPNAKKLMDSYFDTIMKFSDDMKLSSRVRFMLKDAIDLRKNKWQQRRKVEVEAAAWESLGGKEWVDPEEPLLPPIPQGQGRGSVSHQLRETLRHRRLKMRKGLLSNLTKKNVSGSPLVGQTSDSEVIKVAATSSTVPSDVTTSVGEVTVSAALSAGASAVSSMMSTRPVVAPLSTIMEPTFVPVVAVVTVPPLEGGERDINTGLGLSSNVQTQGVTVGPGVSQSSDSRVETLNASLTFCVGATGSAVGNVVAPFLERDEGFVVVRESDVVILSSGTGVEVRLDPEPLFAEIREDLRGRLRQIFDLRPWTFAALGELSPLFRKSILDCFGMFLEKLDHAELGKLSQEEFEGYTKTLGELKRSMLRVDWLEDCLKKMAAQVGHSAAVQELEETRGMITECQAILAKLELKKRELELEVVAFEQLPQGEFDLSQSIMQGFL